MGVILYELTLGRKPAELSDRPLSREVQDAVGERELSRALTVAQQAKDPAAIDPGFPPRLRRIILGCLEKRPENRSFEHAGELSTALRRHLGAPGVEPAVAWELAPL